MFVAGRRHAFRSEWPLLLLLKDYSGFAPQPRSCSLQSRQRPQPNPQTLDGCYPLSRLVSNFILYCTERRPPLPVVLCVGFWLSAMHAAAPTGPLGPKPPAGPIHAMPPSGPLSAWKPAAASLVSPGGPTTTMGAKPPGPPRPCLWVSRGTSRPPSWPSSQQPRRGEDEDG